MLVKLASCFTLRSILSTASIVSCSGAICCTCSVVSWYHLNVQRKHSSHDIINEVILRTCKFTLAQHLLATCSRSKRNKTHYSTRELVFTKLLPVGMVLALEAGWLRTSRSAATSLSEARAIAPSSSSRSASTRCRRSSRSLSRLAMSRHVLLLLWPAFQYSHIVHSFSDTNNFI